MILESIETAPPRRKIPKVIPRIGVSRMRAPISGICSMIKEETGVTMSVIKVAIVVVVAVKIPHFQNNFYKITSLLRLRPSQSTEEHRHTGH